MKKRPDVYFLPWHARERFGEFLESANAGRNIRPGDFTAIKIHFGERGNDGYIDPKWIRPIAKVIRGAKAQPFVTDTNTIYRGARSNAVSHLVVAAEHGYSQTKIGVPVIIADGIRGTNYEEIPIDGVHFKRARIATEIVLADSMVAVAHVKGHLLCGFGGAVKNIGMGCAARVGKYEMHAGTAPVAKVSLCKQCRACIDACPAGAISFVGEVVTIDPDLCVGCGQCVAACNYACLNIPYDRSSETVQERIAEYALGAVKAKRCFYLNFVNHITPNCDCMGKSEEPVADDVGILASTDPVAIDQASLDMLNARVGQDVFHTVWPDIDHTIQLAHAEKIGLGSRKYKLVEC